jgi:hypothetical protein
VTAEAPPRATGAGSGNRNPDPGRVLVLALLAWGTGHAALGDRRTGWFLLGAELVALLLLALLHVELAETTLAVVPFLAGSAFIVAWGAQAIHAYRRARASQHANGPAMAGSPALAIARIGLPLLVWWSYYWLQGGSAASPAAVLDRFLRDAPAIAAGDMAAAGRVAIDPDALSADANAAVEALREACETDACRDSTARSLLHGARVRLAATGPGADANAARAVVESVHYERHESRFLGIFPGSDLVPVADDRLLVLELEARDAPGFAMNLGARRWVITDSRSSGTDR